MKNDSLSEKTWELIKKSAAWWKKKEHENIREKGKLKELNKQIKK